MNRVHPQRYLTRASETSQGCGVAVCRLGSDTGVFCLASSLLLVCSTNLWSPVPTLPYCLAPGRDNSFRYLLGPL